jgi:pimeloyl-ACP methyl ester carboxylesterase
MVLMGHSAAGRHMRAYVTRYPQNVVGLVFVDAAMPLQEEHFPKQQETLFNKPPVQTFLPWWKTAVAFNGLSISVRGFRVDSNLTLGGSKQITVCLRRSLKWLVKPRPT